MLIILHFTDMRKATANIDFRYKLAGYEHRIAGWEMTFRSILERPWFAFWDYWFASNHDQCGWASNCHEIA